MLCRVSRLVSAATAVGRSALCQPASGNRVIAAGISGAWDQVSACLQSSQQAAHIHTGQLLFRAEPAEEMHEDHRAALRSVTPKVSKSSCRRPALPVPFQMLHVYTRHGARCVKLPIDGAGHADSI